MEIWVRPSIVSPPLTLDDWRIRCPVPTLGSALTLVSAHAPHADRPPQEIRHFWQELRQGHMLVGWMLMLTLLAGTRRSCLWGRYSPCDHRSWVLLLALAQDASLHAPGTWSDNHKGPSWTWQHTGGKVQRHDHILVSLGCGAGEHSQCPEFDILNGSARDHMPVLGLLYLCGRRLQGPAPRRICSSASSL